MTQDPTNSAPPDSLPPSQNTPKENTEGKQEITSDKRSLSQPFAHAGLLRVADLGFDANESDSSSKIQITDDTTSIFSIPGERMGHISYGYEGERWKIRNLVWVTAQSATGQKLVEITYKAGYRICFDTMATPQEHATPAINAADKVILLDSRAHPTHLVCTLVYYLALAEASLAGITFDFNMSPPAALTANRLSKAYATALMIQTAHELRTAPSLPEETNRDAYWEHILPAYSRQMEAFTRVAVNEMAISQGTAMASTIRDFYNSPALLFMEDYEVVNYYRSLPSSVLRDTRAMTGHFDPTNIAYKLAFPGIIYAMTHEPRWDPLAPDYMRATAPVAESVAELQQQRRAAGIKDRDQWQIVVANI